MIAASITGRPTGLQRGATDSGARRRGVLVYPSRDEIFGLVPLEALLCGTPVIVADDSGCGEVIQTVGGGQLVPVGDPPPSATIRRGPSPSDWRAAAAGAART